MYLSWRGEETFYSMHSSEKKKKWLKGSTEDADKEEVLGNMGHEGVREILEGNKYGKYCTRIGRGTGTYSFVACQKVQLNLYKRTYIYNEKLNMKGFYLTFLALSKRIQAICIYNWPTISWPNGESSPTIFKEVPRVWSNLLEINYICKYIHIHTHTHIYILYIYCIYTQHIHTLYIYGIFI